MTAPVLKKCYWTCEKQDDGSTAQYCAKPWPSLGDVSPVPPSPLNVTFFRGEKRVLVSYPISQTDRFELYPVSLRLKRSSDSRGGTPPDRSGTNIDGFSDKSKGRLRFLATNSGHLLGTQFCMTYHDNWPTNGTELKRHLNLFLTRLRKLRPDLRYIWIAEFQTRGAPHFHLYSNVERTQDNRRLLANLWNEVADLGNRSHLAFHLHHRNFINWQMKYGNYLCKYLDKAHQKCIPETFHDMKRWWGNSRNLLPSPDELTFEQLEERYGKNLVDLETGEVDQFNPSVWIIRQVGRHHEKVNRRSFFRKTRNSTASLSGGMIFRQLIQYLDREKIKDEGR